MQIGGPKTTIRGSRISIRGGATRDPAVTQVAVLDLQTFAFALEVIRKDGKRIHFWEIEQPKFTCEMGWGRQTRSYESSNRFLGKAPVFEVLDRL